MVLNLHLVGTSKLGAICQHFRLDVTPIGKHITELLHLFLQTFN